MIEKGIVKEIFENKANVVIKKHSACKKCGVCKYDNDEKTVIAQAINNVGAKEGDEVEVSLSFGVLLSASLIAYIIPLIMFVLGCALGFYVLSTNNPVISFITGLVFIMIAYFAIRSIDKKGGFKKKYTMKITKIINSEQ